MNAMTVETVPDAVFAHDVNDRLMDLALAFGSASYASAMWAGKPERRIEAERQADEALRALGREMRAALL